MNPQEVAHGEPLPFGMAMSSRVVHLLYPSDEVLLRNMDDTEYKEAYIFHQCDALLSRLPHTRTRTRLFRPPVNLL